ncbi:MAG: hypothetical protein A2Y14_04370 [Verrucomicrobia bacterium GWF2_51_19]|nr:MAG: hypothetical protein A2Y14_04370 [Verrucomicrobia bacterium GWF2_51_19]HCJ12100.1 hypothetical protein [Opitutae bacterium]
MIIFFKKPTFLTSCRHGFTLLELLFALGIFIFLASIAMILMSKLFAAEGVSKHSLDQERVRVQLDVLQRDLSAWVYSDRLPFKFAYKQDGFIRFFLMAEGRVSEVEYILEKNKLVKKAWDLDGRFISTATILDSIDGLLLYAVVDKKQRLLSPSTLINNSDTMPAHIEVRLARGKQSFSVPVLVKNALKW